jgi:WD40 repeat protein
MNTQVAAGLSFYPYPGLRPFQKSEADIFFGRDQQIDQLLEKLAQRRFLAVLGPSGCGKSSLVRAGLIPALETGFMAQAGYRWRTTCVRPGDKPLANLAEALFEDRVCHAHRESIDDELAFLRATLNRGPLGLIEALKEHQFPQDENLLLLVDQFEEIFRFERHGGRSESRAFVDLLLASAQHPEASVYVALTMRSEFLGQCPLFRGLPEALNDSQFITPRLTRDQIREAILGPASMFNTEIEPGVVTRILNSMGTDPDQLPLMQHLLMRMWRGAALDVVQRNRPRGTISDDSAQTWEALPAFEDSDPPPIPLTAADYEKAGGLARALENHAEKTFKQALSTDGQRRLAQIVFRRLTEINQDGLIIRHPATVAEICQSARIESADPEQFGELTEVIKAFRREGRSFLMPPPDEPLTINTRLDISHETLIHRWERLKSWTNQEDRSRKIAGEVSTKAKRWRESGEQDDCLLTGVDLARAVEWRDELDSDVTQALPDPEMLTFLRQSERQRDRTVRARRTMRLMPLLLSLLAVAIVFGGLAWTQWRAADRQRLIAATAVAQQILGRAQRALMDEDLPGALLWVQDALGRDRDLEKDGRRLQIHRIRLGAGVAQMARLEAVWGQEDMKTGHFIPSPDAKFVLVAGSVEGGQNKTPDELGSVRILELIRPAGTDHSIRPWVRLPHRDPVRHASWSPDGRFVITASANAHEPRGEIHIWNVETRGTAAAFQKLPIGLANASGRGIWTAFSSLSGTDELLAMAIVELQRDKHRVYCWRFDANTQSIEDERFVDIEGIAKWAGFRPVSQQPHDQASEPTDGTFAVSGADKEGKGFVRMYHFSDVTFSERPSDSVALQPSPNGEWKLDQIVNWVHFSRNGTKFAAACGNAIYVFDPDKPGDKQLWDRSHADTVQHVAFSPQAEYVVSSGRDNVARIWRAENGEWLVNLPHKSWVNWAQFSPDGRRVLTASRDHSVKIWEVPAQREYARAPIVPALQHAGAVQQAYFRDDGQQVLTRSINLLRLWNLDTKNPKPSCFPAYELAELDKEAVCRMTHSENGRYAAMVVRDTQQQWHLSTRDLQTEQSWQTALPELLDSVKDLWLDEHGRYVVVAGRGKDTRLGIWICDNASEARKPIPLPLPSEETLYMVKQARFLWLGGNCVLLTVEQPDIQDLRTERKTKCRVRTWDVESGQKLSEKLYDVTGEAVYLASSTDFNHRARVALLTSYEDQSLFSGRIIVWDVRQGSGGRRWPELDLDRPISIDQKENSPVHAAFDLDATRLLTTANALEDFAFLWDLQNPQSPTNRLRLRHTSDITYVAFSNQEPGKNREKHQEYLITCSYDNTARIWKNPESFATPPRDDQSIPDGECIAVLPHDKRVNHAVCSSNEQTQLLATSSQDGATRLWDPQTGELVALFRDCRGIRCTTFLEDPDTPDSRMVQTLSIDEAARTMHVRRWHIDPLSKEEEDCLPLITSLKMGKKERIEPLEELDKFENARKIEEQLEVYKRFLKRSQEG